jgi:hypothetical protein
MWTVAALGCDEESDGKQARAPALLAFFDNCETFQRQQLLLDVKNANETALPL